jgi:hypothetical protein
VDSRIPTICAVTTLASCPFAPHILATGNCAGVLKVSPSISYPFLCVRLEIIVIVVIAIIVIDYPCALSLSLSLS